VLNYEVSVPIVLFCMIVLSSFCYRATLCEKILRTLYVFVDVKSVLYVHIYTENKIIICVYVCFACNRLRTTENVYLCLKIC